MSMRIKAGVYENRDSNLSPRLGKMLIQ